MADDIVQRIHQPKKVYCDRFVLKYKSRYYICIIVGIILYYLNKTFRFTINIDTNSIFISIIKYFDYIVLPRSIGEINPILERRGQNFFASTLILDLSCFIIFLINIITILRDIRNYDLPIIKSKATLWFGGFLALVTMLIRPAVFTPGPSVVNYIDKGGLWLVRESLVISVQYLLFSVLIVNVYVSVRKRKI